MLQRSNSNSSITSSLSNLSLSTSGGAFGKGLGAALGTIKRLSSSSSSGTIGLKHATTEEDIVEEESGDWNYLVVDPCGIRPRDDASYRESKRVGNGCRYKEGDVVQIDRRRKAGWTRWLSCASGDGWVFDISPKNKKVRLIEVEVMQGEWQYEVCEARVPVISSASPQRAQNGWREARTFLDFREIVVATERIRPLGCKGSYLRLSDGRGWVLDFTAGKQSLRRQAGTETSAVWNSMSVGLSSISDRPKMFAKEPIASFDGTADVAMQDVGPPELGEWEYMVLDPKGISLRTAPTYDQGSKNKQRLEEGEIITVLERRQGEGFKFLRVTDPQGWAFERQPGQLEGRLRMMEVTVDTGFWYYLVLAEKGVGLRNRCSFSEACKSVRGPMKGNIVEITRRVKAGETTFLKVKEGGWSEPSRAAGEGGWIFDMKAGRQICHGPVVMQEPPDGTLTTLKSEGGAYLRAGPTTLKWAQTSKVILDGARIQLKCLCDVDGVRWAHVSKPGGMSGWVQSDVLEFDGDRSLGPCQAALMQVPSLPGPASTPFAIRAGHSRAGW